METPQSLRDSSPISGAKWLIFNCFLLYTNRFIVGATSGRLWYIL